MKNAVVFSIKTRHKKKFKQTYRLKDNASKDNIKKSN